MHDARSTRSIIALLGKLVRIPSRGGIDGYAPILDALAEWLSAHEIPHQLVSDSDGAPVGVWGCIGERRGGPCYLLNATVDTASFGDENRWTYPPLSAAQVDGWMYGRGSADSKAGVAIFCHVLESLQSESERWTGSLAYLFDAAEHTGEFAGIRRFMERHGKSLRLDGAMIGYPGNDRIAIGGRGFTRAHVLVHGQSAHTGSSSRHGVNAIWRAARLVDAIQTSSLDATAAEGFPLPPAASVTAVEAGFGFSIVPDVCRLNVDIRLTPAFGEAEAKAFLERHIDAIDAGAANVMPSEIEWLGGWPAYRLAADAPIAAALREAAQGVFGREVPAEVVGPSSVANYLSAQGVPASNGFGVTYRNIHANDEAVALDSIAPVYETYRRALRRLLTG